jgi:hypothetical protein
VFGKVGVGLQVAEDRHRAARLQVGGLPRVADQATGAVPLRRQQPQQAQGDLSVPTGTRTSMGAVYVLLDAWPGAAELAFR